MLTHTKKLFQLSLITLFTALLFLGTVGVNTALAVHQFDIKVVIKEECYDGFNKPIKRTIKSGGLFEITPHSNNLKGKNETDTSPFPRWNAVLFQINNFEIDDSFENFFNTNIAPGDAGIALTKNLLTGTFQTIVDSGQFGIVGNRFMALSGKLVVDKDGNGKKVVGKITGYDGTRECTYNGKFKGKRLQ